MGGRAAADSGNRILDKVDLLGYPALNNRIRLHSYPEGQRDRPDEAPATIRESGLVLTPAVHTGR